MNYWLMKNEPEEYSIDDLCKDKNKTTHWDGVRNYQARNMMRDDMRKDDLAFFYHSNCKTPGIAGIMQIVKESYPDFTALDPENAHYDPKASLDNPRWYMVDVKFKKKFNVVISLRLLRETPALQKMIVLRRGNRLSITPVTKQQWNKILTLEKIACQTGGI